MRRSAPLRKPLAQEIVPGGSRAIDLEPVRPAPPHHPVQVAPIDRLVAGIPDEVIGGPFDGPAAAPGVGGQGGTFSRCRSTVALIVISAGALGLAVPCSEASPGEARPSTVTE